MPTWDKLGKKIAAWKGQIDKLRSIKTWLESNVLPSLIPAIRSMDDDCPSWNCESKIINISSEQT